MLDTGLLLSGLVIAVAVWAGVRWLPMPGWKPEEVLDRLLTAGIVGVLAGRLAAASLDDPGSLRAIRTFLVIRGGVEFWPGAVAAVLVVAVGLRRAGRSVLEGVASLAPIALVGYGAFEGACLLRDGCYGPAAPIGLRPDGLATTMIPAGVVVGAGLAIGAVVLARRSGSPPIARLLAAVVAVALLRSIASIWLPRLGDELTRPHRESIAVAVLSVAGLVAVNLTHRTVAVR